MIYLIAMVVYATLRAKILPKAISNLFIPFGYLHIYLFFYPMFRTCLSAFKEVVGKTSNTVPEVL